MTNHRTTVIRVDAAEAAMLAELTERAAAPGPQARILASLYDKTHTAVDELAAPAAAAAE